MLSGNQQKRYVATSTFGTYCIDSQISDTKMLCSKSVVLLMDMMMNIVANFLFPFQDGERCSPGQTGWANYSG